MRQLSSFIIAEILGVLSIASPAQGAERGSGAAQPAHGSSKSTPAKHAPTHSPQPPHAPSVGAAAPAPVAVRKAASSNASAVVPAVVDSNPVLDRVPVSDSSSDFVSSAATFRPGAPSYDEIDYRNSRINSSGASRTGSDTAATTAAPSTRDTMWAQIDAASSHTQGVLNGRPEYWAAVARLASAEQTITALPSGVRTDSDEIRAASQKASEAREEIARMRMSVLETDPNFLAAVTRD